MAQKSIKTSWDELDSKTKLMAVGTIGLIIASVLLSFSRCSAFFGSQQAGESKNGGIESLDNVQVATDAEPIAIANKDSQLVAVFTEALCSDGLVWHAVDDELCVMKFSSTTNDDGTVTFRFSERDGDLEKTAKVEFYSIETTNNGRSGTWRVYREDGTVADAAFQFLQDNSKGTYTMSSSVFPTYKTYVAKAVTSGDVLNW